MPTSRLFAAASLIPVVAAVALATPGHAQEDLRAKGDRLCNADARHLCREVLKQGEMVVLQCFQAKRAKLSPPCRKFLIDVGQLN